MLNRIFAFALCAVCTAAFAAPADVIDVDVAAEPGGGFRFDVTIRSDETGWDKYADMWQVIAPDGTVLGTRVLAHPHVNEQPFTRSLAGVVIPDGIAQVRLRAHDSVEGWGGQERIVPLPGR